jgi:pilus assembly protein Flp/PilA
MAVRLLQHRPVQHAALIGSGRPSNTPEKNMLARFIHDDQGQDLIEYLLLGSFIAIVALVGATTLGTNLNTWYSKMAGWVSTSSGKIP